MEVERIEEMDLNVDVTFLIDTLMKTTHISFINHIITHLNFCVATYKLSDFETR